MSIRHFNTIDLFCGCGGLSSGFEKAGYNIVLGVDIWEDALKTYRLNHKNGTTLCGDLSKISPEALKDAINGKEVDVIIGGPPCQGFSVAGKRVIEDERNELYKAFVRMVDYFRPKAFVMENVPNIISMGGGIIKDLIIKSFLDIGYNVTYKVITASDYGVPQNRRRAIFIGMLESKFEFSPVAYTKIVTCEEALSDLPEYSVADNTAYTCPPLSKYQELVRNNSSGIYNHLVTEHNAETRRIISMVPDGGNYKNLPENLQQTRKVHIAWTRLNSQKPSITIDTGHRHHFHYKWDRVPTVRESARLQSFQDDFVFLGSKTSQYKQVGNAVPPIMAQAIAEELKKQL